MDHDVRIVILKIKCFEALDCYIGSSLQTFVPATCEQGTTSCIVSFPQLGLLVIIARCTDKKPLMRNYNELGILFLKKKVSGSFANKTCDTRKECPGKNGLKEPMNGLLFETFCCSSGDLCNSGRFTLQTNRSTFSVAFSVLWILAIIEFLNWFSEILIIKKNHDSFK